MEVWLHCKPIPCNEYGVPAMKTGVPCNDNRFFPCENLLHKENPVLTLFWARTSGPVQDCIVVSCVRVQEITLVAIWLMRQLLLGNEGTIETSMGNFLQTASIIGPQICLLSEMIIYVVLYINNKCHNDQMKGSLSNRQIHDRYRWFMISLPALTGVIKHTHDITWAKAIKYYESPFLKRHAWLTSLRHVSSKRGFHNTLWL